MQETWVLSLGWEDPLEAGTANHCSILAWRTRGQRSLARYGVSPWGRKEWDTTRDQMTSISRDDILYLYEQG